jgi:hypothetical protein
MNFNMENKGREGKIAIAGAFLILFVAVFAALYEKKNVGDVDLSTSQGQVLAGQGVRRNLSNPSLPTLPERAQAAEHIVSGKVTKSTSAYETNSIGKLIYTTATITVTERLKGQASGTIEVVMVGGTVDGISMESSKAEKPLAVGEQAVVFLQNQGGKLRVVPGEGNIIRYSANGQIIGEDHDKIGTLEQLKTRIKAK